MSIESPIVAIVDDNLIDAELIAKILEDAQFSTWVCYSAESFFREALAREFDILIIDICLPGENGLSCLRHMNQQKAIGSIVVSGSSDENVYMQALDAGAEMFLSKPIRRQDLLAATQLVMKKLISRHASPVTKLDLYLAPSTRILSTPQGVEIQLTPVETQLLLILNAKAGEIMSKKTIAEQLQLDHLSDPGHRIDVIMSRLRKKFVSQGVESPIRSISGQGKICSQKICIVDR